MLGQKNGQSGVDGGSLRVWLGAYSLQRTVIADEATELRYLLIKASRHDISLLGKPIIAGRAAGFGMLTNGLDQGSARTVPSMAGQDKHILQIADGGSPGALMKEIVRNADELALVP